MSVDATEKYRKLVAEFDTAMFVTATPSGELRSRPMAIADHFKNGDLLFITNDEAPKTKETLQHPQVNVAMQGDNKFLSLSGVATLSYNRELIEKLWKPMWKTWFPKGKDDPDISIITVTANKAEYWDLSGANKMRFLFEAGKALVQGERLDEYPKTMNEKVSFK